MPSPVRSYDTSIISIAYIQNLSRHAQVLEKERVLLIVDDRRDNLSIYLESLTAIGNAIDRRRVRRSVHQDKIGRDILVAYDESKRMLALCASTKVVSICLFNVQSY
jgi:hypothetical protein